MTTYISNRATALTASVVAFLLAAADPTHATTPELLWSHKVAEYPGAQITFLPKDGATVADLDGDGYDEVLAAFTDGTLYAWTHDGRVVPGFPKRVETPGTFFQTTPSVGDIDGDGDPEIVCGARGFTSGNGGLYAWHHDGTNVAGFPVRGIYVDGTVSLEDLNGDGADEIIASERAWPIGYLHVFDGVGRESPGWPQTYDRYPVGQAVADVDGDGDFDVIGLSGYSLYVFDADGTLLPGFPFTPQGIQYFPGDVAAADINADGCSEIAVGYTVGSETDKAFFFLIDGAGSALPGWPRSTERSPRGQPSFGDVDGDGFLEVTVTDYPYGHKYCWNSDGSSLPGFPVGGAGGGDHPVVCLTELGSETALDILADAYTGPYIYAYTKGGSWVPGYPFDVPGNRTGFCSPAIWDIDDDGRLELVVQSNYISLAKMGFYISVYRGAGVPHSVVWAMHKHDRRHTGNYATPLDYGIHVTSFTAQPEGRAVAVKWETDGSYVNPRFNLYRSPAEDEGDKTKLNDEYVLGPEPHKFVDDEVVMLKEYKYWLEAVDMANWAEWHGPAACRANAFKYAFALHQNYPNPARAATTIKFTLPANLDATMTFYDLAGREVKIIKYGVIRGGDHEQALDAAQLAPGVYIYKLVAGEHAAAKKMVVAR